MRTTKVLTSVTYARVGRSAVTGRYITVAEARRRRSTTVIETVRVPRPSKKHRHKK